MTKRIFSMLLIFVLLLGMIPAIAPKADAAYKSDWRYWSQGASEKGTAMVKYGCRLVAQTKLMREAGVVGAGFTPDNWLDWMVKNKGVKNYSDINEIHSSGTKMMEYVRSQGVSISRVETKSLTSLKAAQRVALIKNYIDQGYYVILQSSGHQTYVSRYDSLKQGEVKISDSGSTKTKGQIYTYEGKASATGGRKTDDNGKWTESNYTKAYVYKVGTVPAAAVKPTITTQNVDAGVQVTLKTTTSGATIYYTTDGAFPTTYSKKYTGPFVLTSSAKVRAIAVKSGIPNSAERVSQVTVNKANAPKINVQLTSSGFYVTMTADSGNTVYYTLDGTNPTTSSTKYTGPFTVTQITTVKAVAVKGSKTYSTVATASCSAEVPKTPTAALDSDCSATMGIADSIRFHWSAVANAYAYEYTVTCDGEEVYVGTTQSTKAAYIPTASGSYAVTVKAVNFLGSSAASTPPITVTVKPDVTVRFVDHDGTEIESQTIHYGQDAIAPAAPSREGHTFTKWSGTYVGVKKDTTVTAVYVADTYTVKFLDREGNVLASELVEHGQAVSSVPQAPERTGYTFTGWSVKSGQGNSYTSANGNVVFEPTYTWSNPDLPVGVSIVKALRNADSTGYSLQIQAINSAEQDLTGKLISVIKTGTDKVVATKIDNITIPAGAESFTQSVSLGGSALGSVAEVYIVANDTQNDNRTGGIYAPMATADVKMETAATVTYWSDWSEWSETPVEGSETVEVETKEQYAYSDMETTTSTSSSLAGWTQNGSTVTYGAWGSWSGWTTTKHTASTTKEIQTKTVYIYKHYCNDTGGIAPSTSWSNAKYGPHTLLFTSKQTHDRYSSSTGYYIADGLTKCVKGSGSYYYFGTATGYKYRTRTATTNYNYYRWTDYSDWSDTVYTESDTRNVQTRTLYRCRTLMTVTSTEESNVLGTEDTSGTVYSISGTLTNVEQDYSGKTAVVMIYKDKNIDPTEDQMEYIGQITVGQGNSYELAFVPKEEISEQTGNYIVSFGIATADGLINNVEVIEAPKPTYNVVFRDTEGNILSTQTVTQGQDAQAPELPELTGYDVTWNRSFTNVQADLVVRAVATAKTYNLIFVDWANDKILAIEEACYGDPITFPDDCTAEGKIFTGWSVPEGSTVTGTTVIEAMYEDITFTVNFLNLDGTVFTTQQVNYGDAATLPEEVPVAEGYTFVAWSTDDAWYDVKADMSVEPIFIYEQTAVTPVRHYEQSDERNMDSATLELEVSTENATVYYTTDGTDPTEDSPVYTEPLVLEETTVVKAMTCRSGMNSSDIAEFNIGVYSTDTLPVVAVATDSGDYSVGYSTVTLPVTVSNEQGYTLVRVGYFFDTVTSNEAEGFDLTLDVASNSTSYTHVFEITDLAQDTQYSIVAYAEFEQIGVVTSELLDVTTGCDHDHSYTETVIEGDCQTEVQIQHTCHCGKTYLEDLAEFGAHVYEDGSCTLCGAAEPIKWYGVNTTLGGALSLNFALDTTQLNGTTGNYIVLTRSYADDRADHVITIDQADWSMDGTFAIVSYTDIAAKEMSDVISAAVYNADGDIISEIKSDSIATYALRMLGKESVNTVPVQRTLFVDMLNYGAAAQTFFGYNTENLANAALTAEQAAWATEEVTISDNRLTSDNCFGTNLNLESEIILQIAFAETYTEGMYAVATFTDHYGEVKKQTLSVTKDGSFVIVTVTGMAIADYRNMVTCKLYSADGTMLGHAIDSMESYVARNTAKLGTLGEAIMKLGASGYAYFHS